MSVAQIMQEIDTLSPQERLKVQTYLVHLRRKDDPAYRAELAKRIDRMQRNQGVSPEDMLRHVEPFTGPAAE